jgi:hypothetical protein
VQGEQQRHAGRRDQRQRQLVANLTASVAAELGMRAFDRGFAQWGDPACHQPLTELVRQALEDFRPRPPRSTSRPGGLRV